MKKNKMEAKEKKTYQYTFSITLSGCGISPEQAWEDAVESFMQDPGTFDTFKREGEI